MSSAARVRARRGIGRACFGWVLFAALALTLAFLVLPVVAIFVNTSPARLLSSLGQAQSLDALRLSLETSVIAIAIIVLVGTPAAYLLARRSFRAHAAILTLLELPLVLPPAVAGIGLLAALGPHGILGAALAAAHLQLELSTAAVVVALTFVSAPFYLRQAYAAFAAVDRTYLEAAQALGAGEYGLFRRVALPLARPGLSAGVALAWARALGEFGATLMFAGSFQGVTQTAPLAIYDEFASDFPGALALSAILVVVSGALLLTVKLMIPATSPPRRRGASPPGVAGGPQPPM
jgi:molybdate transport system permease protein